MRFVLTVEDALPGDERKFTVSLGLDGSESVEEAVSRFGDALAVFRNSLAAREGRSHIVPTRIDGRPSADEAAAHAEAMRVISP